MSDVRNQVKSIIERLENTVSTFVTEDGQIWDHSSDCECGLSETHCECESNGIKREINGWDYLQDVLDINWILNSDKTYKGARVLVAFGGPNIWIDTVKSQVEGYWWSDTYIESYSDAIDLDAALEELWECQ
ncbi:conserved hypothetical protein [Vibrio phage 142E35-1]|nr:conserved hypothetical protein [Vibrio phage 142E35-1]